jgi:DNA-binding MarR family transcriptional regulator
MKRFWLEDDTFPGDREAAFSTSLEHGLTLKEYEVLTCCLYGQMTDAEVRNILSMKMDDLDAIVESLVSKELLRRNGRVLAATYEGELVYKWIAKDAA